MGESELVRDLAAFCCIYEISYCWGPIEIIMQSSRVSNPTRAQEDLHGNFLPYHN